MPYASISKRESLSPSIGMGILKAFLEQKGILVRALSEHLRFYYDMKNYKDWTFVEENFRIPSVNAYGIDMLYMSIAEEMDSGQFLKLAKLYYKRKKTARYYYFGDFYDKLTDFRKELESFIERVISRINLSDDTIIGMSCIHGQMFASVALAKKIKSINPKSKIIFGGIDCQGNTTKMLLRRYRFIDAVAVEEGEIPLLEFINSGGNAEGIDGLAYRYNDHEIVVSHTSQPIPMSNLPTPDFSDFFEVLKPEDMDEVTIPVFASRGCPWKKCTFCNVTTDHRFNYRCKDIGQFIQEIENYQRLYPQIQEFVMTDDDISVSEEFYQKLAKETKGKGLLFSGHSRADRLTEHMVKAMRECGFYGIEVGIESFSDNILSKINKGTNVSVNIKALKLLRESGIESWSNLMPLYPTETIDDVKETIKVIEKIKHLLYGSNLTLSSFALYPRCDIWNNAKKWGITGIKLEACEFLPGYDINEGSWYTMHGYEYTSETGDIWDDIEKKLRLYTKIFYPCYYRVVDQYVVVYDYRWFGGKKNIILLDKDASKVLMACVTQPKTLESISKELTDDTKLEQIITELMEKDLLYCSRQKFYIALPTKIYPAIEKFLSQRIEIDSGLISNPFEQIYYDINQYKSANRALLIIDMQKAMINNEFSGDLPKLIREYILNNPHKYHSIYFSIFKNDLESLFATWHEYKGCMNHPDIDIADELVEFSNDCNTFYKTGFSALMNDSLKQAFIINKIREIDIVGNDTDACVYATAMDAFQNNIKPNVIIDLCRSSTGIEAHLQGVAAIKRSIQNI